MLQRLEDLFPTASGDLHTLSEIIRDRVIASAGPSVSAVDRYFADEMAYLSVSYDASDDSDDPTISLEFGVHGGGERRVVGVFVAHWQREANTLGELERILLHGSHADPSPFLEALTSYIELPVAAAQVS